MIKNILILLFVFTIGLGMGLYYGFLNGQTFYNKWLVVSAYNDGFTQGHVAGGVSTMYMIFEEQIQSTYKLPSRN